jgi:predicted ABC-type ATPase
LLRGVFEVEHFVNADVIAQGLSQYAPESVAFEAGRTMLRRLDELAAEQANFAFESTLSSRTFAPWLKKRKAQGYSVSIFSSASLHRKPTFCGWPRGSRRAAIM